jgi:hypothetical protein
MLASFEKATWPVATSEVATTRMAAQGARIDIGARMRGLWR